jgi:hypothetical protein
MLIKISSANREQNEIARTLKHEGIRIGEITAYRAWRVIGPHSWWQGDDLLRSHARLRMAPRRTGLW